jgi:hypothetical protein
MGRVSRSMCRVPSGNGDDTAGGHSEELIIKEKPTTDIIKRAKQFPAAVESSIVPRVRRNGNRIGINQRMRVMGKFVGGKTQVEIAKEEGIDRETVRRIVTSPELNAYVEEKKELWRGLCDEALEAVRRLLRENDRQVALRVLESNGVIPPEGVLVNQNIQTQTMSKKDRETRQILGIAAVIQSRHATFGIELPDEMKQAVEKVDAEIAKEKEIE